MSACLRVSAALTAASFAVALAVSSVGCGGGAAPTQPEAPPANTAGTPTPAPEPVATPRITGCGVGKGPGAGQNCPRTGPSFLAAVDTAINSVGKKQPGLFNFSDIRGREGWYVNDIDAYYVAVVKELEEMGYCALVDRGNEIAVKKTNDLSDQYHIMISDRHVRRDDASYRATCTPAWF
jgi:hypothetical protein